MSFPEFMEPLQAISHALLVLFFVIGVMKTCGSLTEVKRPEHALRLFVRSVFASSPPVVDENAVAASMTWNYIGELIFNMLILVDSVKMADRVVQEMTGLKKGI